MKKILPVLFLSLVLISCKDDPDPCEGVTCMNGGVCINGQCDCPDNYEGVSCADQKTPAIIRVSKVTVTKFSATEEGGASWDVFPSSSGPDIFPVIWQGDNNLFQGLSKTDANPAQGHDFTPGSALDLKANTAYVFELYDDDGSGVDPDWLGGIEFTITKATLEGFPEQLTFDCNECKVAFKLSVAYIF